MLGKIVIALVIAWASVQATPTGEHTCFGVIKHPVTVRVNVTEPVTFRTYTWCLRVPPRCSKYTVQLKDRVKVQTEMHNKTITVCCKGYVEMEYKCVPACPPHNECPNMHCNRTNHCYCTPGYMGLYCTEPCTRGFWGKDCKKPCDCPDGYTCHHLTGDCMLDDSPPKPKKVARTTTSTTAEPTTMTKPIRTTRMVSTTHSTTTTETTTKPTTTTTPTTTSTTTTTRPTTTTITTTTRPTTTTTKAPTTTEELTTRPTTTLTTTTSMPTTPSTTTTHAPTTVTLPATTTSTTPTTTTTPIPTTPTTTTPLPTTTTTTPTIPLTTTTATTSSTVTTPPTTPVPTTTTIPTTALPIQIVEQFLTAAASHRGEVFHGMFPLRTGHHDNIQRKEMPVVESNAKNRQVKTETTSYLPVMTLVVTTSIPISVDKAPVNVTATANSTFERPTTSKPFKHPVIMHGPTENHLGEVFNQSSFAPSEEEKLNNTTTLSLPTTKKLDEFQIPIFPHHSGDNTKQSSTPKTYVDEFSNHLPTVQYSLNTTNYVYETSIDHENSILRHAPTNQPFVPITEVIQKRTKDSIKLFNQENNPALFNLSYILNNIGILTANNLFKDKEDDTNRKTNMIGTTRKITPLESGAINQEELNIQSPIFPLQTGNFVTKPPNYERNNYIPETTASMKIPHATFSPTGNLNIDLKQKNDKSQTKSSVFATDLITQRPKNDKNTEMTNNYENNVETNTVHSVAHTDLSKEKSDNDENSEPNDTRKFLSELMKKFEQNLTEPHAAGVQAERDDEAMINFLSGLSFVLGCIAVITIVVMLTLFLRRWKKTREKSLMEDVILAYAPTPEAALNPLFYGNSNYSVLRLATTGTPQTFFCPTFTNNYAEQLNRELCELNYDHPRNDAEPLYAEISN